MSAEIIVRLLPWLIASASLFGTWNFDRLYENTKTEFSIYKAKMIQASEDQRKALEKIAADNEDHLKEVRKDYEQKIADIERSAVAAYRMRNPIVNSVVCQPRPAENGSQPVDDGAKQEFVPVDAAFIGQCAEDAAKVTAWQDLCKRDNCKIED